MGLHDGTIPQLSDGVIIMIVCMVKYLLDRRQFVLLNYSLFLILWKIYHWNTCDLKIMIAFLENVTD
jgi:hypothetical protein